METNIVHDMLDALGKNRDTLSDLEQPIYNCKTEVNDDDNDEGNNDGVANEDITFDLDQQLNGVVETVTQPDKLNVKKGKSASQLKREQRDVDNFKSTLHYFELRRKEGSKSKGVKTDKPMDIVNDISEIDDIDNGKSWKQLDNWLRRKKLSEFAKSSKIDDYGETLLELYNKGEFRKTNQVVYDCKEGVIKELSSKYLVLSK